MKKILLTIASTAAFLNILKAQSINPYEAFGYKAKNEYVRTKKPEGYEVTNNDSTASAKSIIISPRFNKVFEYDRSGEMKVTSVNGKDEFRFLSVDPLSNKYPELTPYQFASNRPMDGVDQDGLEWMKYNKDYTSTIVFPSDESQNDGIIRAEYSRAMHDDIKMNVVKTRTLSELVGYLKQKGTTYDNLIFTGHGRVQLSTLKMGDEEFLEKQGFERYSLIPHRNEVAEIGSFIKDGGTLILTACFQATPKYNTLRISLNGERLTKELSAYLGRNVLGSQGATFTGWQEFSGNQSLSGTPNPNSAADIFDAEKIFYGKWSLTKPNGNIIPVGDITLNQNGQWASTITSPSNTSTGTSTNTSTDSKTKKMPLVP